jgi:putative transposase
MVLEGFRSRLHVVREECISTLSVQFEFLCAFKPGQYLMHDRDTKFCAAFKQFLDDAGVKRLPLPAKSPNLNAIAERWIRSVKEEALSKLILFGEQSLWYVLSEYVAHYHQERPHQGKGNMILFPTDRPNTRTDGPIRCRERLGGLLTYYDREAA